MKRVLSALLIAALFLAGIGCLFFTDIVYFLASQRQGKVIEDYLLSAEALNAQRLEVEYQRAVRFH